MFVVQIIEILWTKATRGAPRANERVALPRAFPIQDLLGPYFVQRYKIAEWEKFQPELVSVEAKKSVPESEHVLSISKEADGSFRLGIGETPNQGQPMRHPSRKAIRLSSGDFVCLIVNARHTTYSGQYYSETIFNVTSGDQISADRFLIGPPDRLLDLKEHLF